MPAASVVSSVQLPATTVAVPSSVLPLNTCTLAMPAPPVSATVPAKCTPPALVMKSLFEVPLSLVSVTVGNVSLGGVASSV